MRRLAATIALAILAVAVLVGCGPTLRTPNVVGLRLDKAHQAFEALGIKEFDDKDAFENRNVMVDSNWAVLGQDPAAGTTLDTDTKIKLTIGKIGEARTTARLTEGSPVLAKIRAEAAKAVADKAAADKAAAAKEVADKAAAAKEVADKAAAAKAAASRAKAAKAAILTVGNNKDFAALLASGKLDLDAHEAFVAKYQGKTIEFDGCIAFMMAHGNYKTRFDFLIYRGNYDGSHTTGPSFNLVDASYFDLHLTGSSIPDTVSAGQNLHFVAMVEGFDKEGGAILLEPISTEAR